ENHRLPFVSVLSSSLITLKHKNTIVRKIYETKRFIVCTMSGIPGTAVVQVTNLSSAVSSEQMRTLFGFLGDIEELRLYPPE
ncbi:hypothetical protein XENOCAPTIV_012813, partial [Xenoophorus captivus]